MNTINFDYIRKIPQVACQRAAVFLGLGVNAARDPEFERYQLHNITTFQVIPDNASKEQIAIYKEHFEEWVISSALRELIESFAVFLDRVHQACLLMSTSKNLVSPDDAESWGPAFERKGLKDKLKKLRQRFEITTEREDNLCSITKARNCITHRRGIVGKEDTGEDDDQLTLHWWRLELIARGNCGKEYSMKPPISRSGITLDTGGAVIAKFSDKLKIYKLGEVIRLEANDLSEIIFLVQWSSDEILKKLLAYSLEIGINVKNKNGDSITK